MIAVGRLVEVVLSGLFLGWYLFWICWLGDVELNVGRGVVYMIFRVLGCWGLLGGVFGGFLVVCSLVIFLHGVGTLVFALG